MTVEAQLTPKVADVGSRAAPRKGRRLRAFVRNPRPAVGNVLRRAGQVDAIRKTGAISLRGFPQLHQRVKRIVYPNSYVPVAPQISTTFEHTPPPVAMPLETEPLAIVCDAVMPANDALLAALSIAPPPERDARDDLGAGARAVLAQIRSAQARFGRTP